MKYSAKNLNSEKNFLCTSHNDGRGQATLNCSPIDERPEFYAARESVQNSHDGEFDSLIGQWIGAHPDGTTPIDFLFNDGGTGSVGSQISIGGASFTLQTGNFPYGAPGFVTLTWRKLGKRKYCVKTVSLQAQPTILSKVPSSNLNPVPTTTVCTPPPCVSSVGVFPTVNPQRVILESLVKLSHDDRTAKVYFGTVKIYNIQFTPTYDPLVPDTVVPGDFSVLGIILKKVPPPDCE